MSRETVQLQRSIYKYSDNSVTQGSYTYRLKQIDFDGTLKYSNESEVKVNIPSEFSLSQNYPNPFNPSTQISFSIPDDAIVSLNIYNTLGEKVAELINGFVKAGNHIMSFNASDLASGVYYYRINTNKFTSTKKMILLR